MTHDFETLPNLLSALEDELRSRAGGPAPATSGTHAPRRAWRRPAAGLALVAACAAVLVLLPGSIGREANVAYGDIPLLASRAEPVPAYFRDARAVRDVGGPGARITEAWSFDVPRGTGYLLRGQGLWCLAVPVPAGERSDESAMSCVSDLRYGIGVSNGDTYVAAVPKGVPGPTITFADGVKLTLRPNAEGIAVADAVTPGATVLRHGTDGTTDESPLNG